MATTSLSFDPRSEPTVWDGDSLLFEMEGQDQEVACSKPTVWDGDE